MEGRGRHLHLYGRLTDVLDSDRRFAAAALAHRDAVDELAGIYSLRLQRALDSVYAVQRRTVRTDLAASALADGVRVVQSIDQWYLDAVDQLHGEFWAAAPPERERADPAPPSRGGRGIRAGRARSRSPGGMSASCCAA